MPEELFAQLLKLSIPTALLGWTSYTLWKRFDARVKQTEIEMKELRARYDKEILTTRNEIRDVVKENSIVIREMKEQSISTNMMMGRTSNLMECLIKEIREVKPQFIQSKPLK